MAVLTTKEIMDIIPHRHPFLLVDTIEELEPASGQWEKNALLYDEYFFRGHFPQEPVMPGVLIVEALAQVGAVSILSCEQFKGKRRISAESITADLRRKWFPGMC